MQVHSHLNNCGLYSGGRLTRPSLARSLQLMQSCSDHTHRSTVTQSLPSNWSVCQHWNGIEKLAFASDLVVGSKACPVFFVPPSFRTCRFDVSFHHGVLKSFWENEGLNWARPLDCSLRTPCLIVSSQSKNYCHCEPHTVFFWFITQVKLAHRTSAYFVPVTMAIRIRHMFYVACWHSISKCQYIVMVRLFSLVDPAIRIEQYWLDNS